MVPRHQLATQHHADTMTTDRVNFYREAAGGIHADVGGIDIAAVDADIAIDRTAAINASGELGPSERVPSGTTT